MNWDNEIVDFNITNGVAEETDCIVRAINHSCDFVWFHKTADGLVHITNTVDCADCGSFQEDVALTPEQLEAFIEELRNLPVTDPKNFEEDIKGRKPHTPQPPKKYEYTLPLGYKNIDEIRAGDFGADKCRVIRAEDGRNLLHCGEVVTYANAKEGFITYLDRFDYQSGEAILKKEYIPIKIEVPA